MDFKDNDLLDQGNGYLYFKDKNSDNAIRFSADNVKKVDSGYVIIDHYKYKIIHGPAALKEQQDLAKRMQEFNKELRQSRQAKKEEYIKKREEMKSWTEEQWNDYYTECDLERERRKEAKADLAFWHSATTP